MTLLETFVPRLNRAHQQLSPSFVNHARRAAVKLEKTSDQELANRSQDLRLQTAGSKQLDEAHVVELAGLAIVAISRTFGFAPHDVQLLGAAESALGRVIDMKTGEGKTIVAGLTAYLLSSLDKGVHVATTNDYLADRDYEILQPFFERLGVSVGLLKRSGSGLKNRAACECDVTYGPGYQFGFDFLIDQVTLRQQQQLLFGADILNALNDFSPSSLLIQQRNHGCTVIDEADSVLVDEATTPLVLSGGAPEPADERPYRLARELTDSFQDQNEFIVMNDHRIVITAQGRKKAMEAFHQMPSFHLERPWIAYVENAIRAKVLFQRDEHYVVREGKICIVDQFTGRIFDDRTWQNGLHQAVEAKEQLDIYSSPPPRARITRQRYFQKYQLLCGMTGTATQVRREFEKVYRVGVTAIPTRVACRRQVLKAKFFGSWESKLAEMSADVLHRHKTGQPILIGTRTIRESLYIESALKRQGLSPIVLNGIQDADEAEIIALAGQTHALTIATNMAGRGTDIKLAQQARELGGLHVIVSEPHSSTRIDEQLIGRCARQGDPGTAQMYVSAEDDFLVNKAPELSLSISRDSDASGRCSLDFTRAVVAAQAAEEDYQFHVRQQLVLQDNWFDEVRRTISSYE